jgi:hypothetical protein
LNQFLEFAIDGVGSAMKRKINVVKNSVSNMVRNYSLGLTGAVGGFL